MAIEDDTFLTYHDVVLCETDKNMWIHMPEREVRGENKSL